MRTEIINGEPVRVSPSEHKQNYPCPVCGGDLITNFGPGISITFCIECGYSDTDYDF